MHCFDGMQVWGWMGLPFVALVRQRIGNKGGHLVHEVIRDAAVQQACEAAHVTLPCSFTLCFHLHHHRQHCSDIAPQLHSMKVRGSRPEHQTKLLVRSECDTSPVRWLFTT